jgi:hypothetical protein
VITRGDLVRFSESEVLSATVFDCATKQLVVAHPKESLHDAIHKLLVNDIGRLPVVDPAEPSRLIGWLSRRAILSARWKILDEESPGVSMRLPRRRSEISVQPALVRTISPSSRNNP